MLAHPLIELMIKLPSFRPLFLGQALLPVGMLALASFAILPNSYALMVQWPWVLLWQVGFGLIAFWGLWRMRQFHHPLQLLGWQLDWAIGLSLISLTLSTLVGYRPATSVWYLVMAASYGVCLYALVNWLDQDRVQARQVWLARAIGVVAIGASVSSLVLWWPIRTQMTEAVNPFPLGHHNFVAGYLVLVIPMLLALTWSHSGWRRIGWAIGTFLAMSTLYTTGSRGGVIGILGVLVVAGIVVIVQQWQQRHWRSLLLMTGSSLGLLILLLLHPRAQRLIQALSVGQIDGTSRFRVFTIEAGLRLWQEHAWLGVGPGNTVKLYDIYRPIEAATEAARVQQLHCTPVNLLAELGLLGLLAYALWIILLGRLAGNLAKQLPPDQRSLLYGASGGLLAYLFSSLTDYQLENIGISLTIVSLLALLISQGHQIRSAPAIVATRLRRYYSLLGFTLLLGALRLWIPVDVGMMFAATGTAALQRGDLLQFYDRWSIAAKVVPWEPYYPFVLGAQLSQLIELYGNTPLLKNSAPQVARLPRQAQFQEQLSRSSQTYLETALDLVPFDELFNRYLGAVLVDRDPAEAVLLLQRAAQLAPRKPYVYALLGVAYLNQQNPQAAIRAFALEGMINPSFLTTDVWFEPTLQPLWQPTLQLSIQLYRDLLAALPPGQSNDGGLSQNWIMLRWWAQLQSINAIRQPIASQPSRHPIPPSELQRLTIPAQAVVLISQGQPDRALARLRNESGVEAALLRAWIDPKTYLPTFKAQKFPAFIPIMETLERTIAEHRQIQSWLLSIHYSQRAVSERIGFFSYRNMNGPDLIEVPRSLPLNLLVNELTLFIDPPYFPLFDQHLVRAQKQFFNLDRPQLGSDR